MAWVRVCEVGEAPGAGELRLVEAGGKQLCLVGGVDHWRVIGNDCPHRGAPLHEGSVEAGKVVCPWHAWAFDLETGKADHDPSARVPVYPVELREGYLEAEL